MKCPLRKEVMSMKIKESKGVTSYSTVTKRSTATQPTEVTQSQAPVTSLIYSTVLSCQLYVYFVNASNPGTFNAALNKLYKTNNNLPPINITGDSPSLDIIKKMQEEHKKKSCDNQAASNDVRKATITKGQTYIQQKTKKHINKNKSSKKKHLNNQINW